VKIYYADTVPLNLPEGHRFPAIKYPLLRQRVFDSGLFTGQDLVAAEPASKADLLRVHTEEYVSRIFEGTLTEREQRRTGLPWSPELVDRSRRSVGGTIAACRSAIAEGVSAYLGGGTHHAYPDHGEGFCVFNDVAVAVRSIQAEERAQGCAQGRARRVVIFDLDVHQGNGSAAIFKGDDTVFTFSIHGEKNFPYHKEQGDLDIALPDGCQDDEFLQTVEWGIQDAHLRSKPDWAVYIAGADPFSGDRLGRMEVTKEGLATRDEIVLSHCLDWRLPVAIVMGGGYARQIEDVVDIHMQTIRIAQQFSSRWQPGYNPIMNW